MIYGVWAIILAVHRKAVTTTQKEAELSDDNAVYANNNGGNEVYNPTTNSNASVAVDEAEL